MKRVLFTFLGICAVANCDSAGPENQNPIAVGFIDPIEIFVDERRTLTVADYFSDPDGDMLTYEVMSMDPANLEALVAGDEATLRGLGVTTTKVKLIASDIYDATVELSADVTVIDAVRDNFDSDLGWRGFAGTTPVPERVRIAEGKLNLFVSAEYIQYMAVRDIETVGPNWYYEGLLDITDETCGGLLAFTAPVVPDEIPGFIWAIDLDPFGGWFATLWVREVGDWFILEESNQLPQMQDDGWDKIGIGLTEEGIFYGIAGNGFKLFEFDTVKEFEGYGFDLPSTITEIGIGGTPCDVAGRVIVEEVSVGVRIH